MAVESTTKKMELRQLTGIRIIAAIWVVFYHFHPQFTELVPELSGFSFLSETGYLAVDLFFVLSGFILAYQYLRKTPFAPAGYLDFLVKRLARIYPLMFLTTLFLVLVVIVGGRLGVNIANPSDFTAWGAAQDLTLTRGWIIPSQGWNFPAWSLSSEWLAYLAFPVVAAGILWLSGKSKLLLLVAVLTLFAVEALSAQFLPSINGMPIPDIRVLVAFSLGVIGYVGRSYFPKGQGAGIAGVVCLAVLISLTPFVPIGGWRTLSAIVLCSLIVPLLAVSTGFWTRILGGRCMEYGGKISFSLYMVHGILLMLLVHFVNVSALSDLPFALRLGVVVAELVFIVIVSAATYQLIENPSHNFIKRRWSASRWVGVRTAALEV